MLAFGVAVIGRAEGVVAQNLDHPAIGDAPTRALHDHPLKFCLQGHQSGEAAFNLGQLRPGDGISSSAGLVGSVRQAEEIADRFQREAQIEGMPNEGQPFQCLATV